MESPKLIESSVVPPRLARHSIKLQKGPDGRTSNCHSYCFISTKMSLPWRYKRAKWFDGLFCHPVCQDLLCRFALQLAPSRVWTPTQDGPLHRHPSPAVHLLGAGPIPRRLAKWGRHEQRAATWLIGCDVLPPRDIQAGDKFVRVHRDKKASANEDSHFHRRPAAVIGIKRQRWPGKG